MNAGCDTPHTRSDRVTGHRVTLTGGAWCNYLFVELFTVEGLTGLGEATMQYQSRAVSEALELLVGRYITGRDPFEIERAVALMYREEYARGGPVLNSAIAGIEMALWDIVGKTLGEPVHRILGGAVRSGIPAYANAWFAGAESPADWAARARETVALGYRALKFDPYWPAGREPEEAELRRARDIIGAVAEAVGPEVRLLIDGHGRFSPGAAAREAHVLAELGVHWFEEPVDPENHRALGALPRPGGLRIATGERCWSRYQIPSLISDGRPDVLQPDPIQVGGILEAKKIAAIADAHYLPVSFHNPFGPVATAAALAVGATVTNLHMQESFSDFDGGERYALVTHPPRPEAGVFRLNEAPGLGLALDRDACAERPYRDDAMVSIWGGNRDF